MIHIPLPEDAAGLIPFLLNERAVFDVTTESKPQLLVYAGTAGTAYHSLVRSDGAPFLFRVDMCNSFTDLGFLVTQPTSGTTRIRYAVRCDGCLGLATKSTTTCPHCDEPLDQ
jgi:hypothetical protein